MAKHQESPLEGRARVLRFARSLLDPENKGDFSDLLKYNHDKNEGLSEEQLRQVWEEAQRLGPSEADPEIVEVDVGGGKPLRLTRKRLNELFHVVQYPDFERNH